MCAIAGLMNIVHLTSVHARSDTRIRKQCRDLAAAGHVVSLIVADGLGDENDGDVSIIDVGRTRGRLARMLVSAGGVWRRARRIDADVYHFHDPELLPYGVALARGDACVIYDAHEDLSKQLLTKPYLGRFAAPVVSRAVALVERWAVRRLSAVVGATDSIAQSFDEIASRTEVVNNFPIVEELAPLGEEAERDSVVFVGKLSEIRGIREAIQAMPLVQAEVGLTLVGDFADPEFAASCRCLDGYARVTETGVLDRSEVRRVLEGAVAGLVTFHPSPNHIDAQPNKLFEYMAAGVPVIASDFPQWRRLVGDAGICVDPQDPVALAAAIDKIAADRDLASAMGRAGSAATRDVFNWTSESRKLVALYAEFG